MASLVRPHTALQDQAGNGSHQPAGPIVPVTVARGDGIGPEIMEAVLFLLGQAGARLELDEVQIGRRVYEQGLTSGIDPDAWHSLRRTRVFLKAPITTPQGSGYKSLNVTVRKTLGLFANVRPCPTYHPFVATSHPGMDVVIVRENEEDTYGGIEHRQTPEVTQCLKLITTPGTEKVVRYAFEYARQQNRRKVTCFTKDNIMKITDGLFHRIFDQVAADYPDIQSEHRIIDIGSAKLAKRPTDFDVIVTPNLYGDIVSDIAAEVAGSVGLAGSANIGDQCAMFEAVHGSAPDIAGKGVANPSGLLHAAIMMLQHIGQGDVAQRLHNAWLRTIEDGILTADVESDTDDPEHVGTHDFTMAVANRIGHSPRVLEPAPASTIRPLRVPTPVRRKRPVKQIMGVDVFLDWDDHDRNVQVLGRKLERLAGPDMKLKMVTNRGTKVYPGHHAETFCTDHWRCRFTGIDGEEISHGRVIALLSRLQEAGLDFIKTEHLCHFDGEPGYSLGQGE